MSYTSPLISTLDQKYIDIDFDREAADTGNLCGMLPPPDELAGYSPDYEASMPVYQESEWADRIARIDAEGGWLERYIREICNQSSEPSCVYNALAQAQEVTWNKQFGTDKWRKLSPISGYRWNGTARSGSSVPGAIVWSEATGLLPETRNTADVTAGFYSVTHPATGYGVKPKDGWKDTAKFFRAHEWMKINTVEGWVSALLNGWVCVGGRDMHCICHVRPMMDSGRVISMYANSWKSSWGDKQTIAGGVVSGGFGYDSRSKISTMVGRGAWSLRTVLKPSWLKV